MTDFDPTLIQKIERIHNNHDDPKLQSFKLLGVYLDEQLTLNKHVDHVAAKLSRSLYLLNRVKHYVSDSSPKTLFLAVPLSPPVFH
jgi:hypothetical protein